MSRFNGIVLLVALSIASIAAAPANSAPLAGAPTNDSVAAFALRWYTEMQAGRFDRTQYTTPYGAQLTPEAVQAMSQQLNRYGASPEHAEILQKRAVGNQTFYQVKLVFPRGDAASLLLGLDPAGKVTGIEIMSLAGD
jgi:hypothetical protein